MLFNISFVHWLVVLSVFITLVGAGTYIKDTLTGKTKPNRISWALWGVAPLIGVGAALSAHADPVGRSAYFSRWVFAHSCFPCVVY